VSAPYEALSAVRSVYQAPATSCVQWLECEENETIYSSEIDVSYKPQRQRDSDWWLLQMTS